MLGCAVTDSHIGKMETAEMDPAMISSISGQAWGAAAHYRQLIQQQQQQQQQQAEDEGAAASDDGSTSSPRPESPEAELEVGDNRPPTQSVLDKLKQQVEDVTNGRHRQPSEEEPSEYHLQESLRARAAAEAQAALQRHPLSPQSLLAASMASNPPSLVPLPSLGGLAGYGGAGGRASVSPPAREATSPPSSSAAHSPRQPAAGNQASWNFEEQFKQLYEIDDNPKRKEFLDELFRFMQERGTPINRLPIMAKQVLDMYELYNLVVAQGGLVQVINKKLWQEIIKGLKLPSSITSAAFTLRTQYMKYLYPYECHKQGLSSPSELQTAIDGNKREGRRSSTYSNNSYAELMQRAPMMTGQMAPSFGLGNGMPLPTTLHQQGLSPLSLVTSRPAGPGSNGPTVHPIPPSSPFLPSMVPPGLPTPNDTLMTLWNLYSSRQAAAAASPPPARRHEQSPAAPAPAPQSEALNLGVHRDATRLEKERDIRRGHENGTARERKRPTKRERQEQAAAQRIKKAREESDEIKADALPHTKTTITQNGDSSMVLSMEMNGVVYQGVLFAQPKTARV